MFSKLAHFLLSQLFLQLSCFGQQVSRTGKLQIFYLFKFPENKQVRSIFFIELKCEKAYLVVFVGMYYQPLGTHI